MSASYPSEQYVEHAAVALGSQLVLLWWVRTELTAGELRSGVSDAGRGKSFVDFQNDVTVDDIEDLPAARRVFVRWHNSSRYTTLGMATDEGEDERQANALMAARRPAGIAARRVADLSTAVYAWWSRHRVDRGSASPGREFRPDAVYAFAVAWADRARRPCSLGRQRPDLVRSPSTGRRNRMTRARVSEVVQCGQRASACGRSRLRQDRHAKGPEARRKIPRYVLCRWRLCVACKSARTVHGIMVPRRTES